MKTLATDGESRQSEEAQRVLGGLAGKLDSAKSARCGKERLRLQRGENCTADEYVSTELLVGPLSFECVDLGETLKLTISLKKKARIGQDIEMANVQNRRYRRWRNVSLRGNPSDAHREPALAYWLSVFGWRNI